MAALIVYGSLSPFVFYERGSFQDAVRYLLSTRPDWFDRGDALANILLYIPLGLFGARAMERIPAALRVPAMAIAGGLLSVSIEITQFWDLTRATQLSDVTANFAGAFAGAAVEACARTAPMRRFDRRPFETLLLAAALGMWLFPYLPSLHPHRWVEVVERALAEPLDGLSFFRQLAFWLAAAALAEEISGAAARRILLPVGAGVVLLARILIPSSFLTPADVAGAVAGVSLWLIVSRSPEARSKAWIRCITAVFVLYVMVEALRPFTWLAHPRHFEWTPFVSFMLGSRGFASRTFLEKAFTYGALVWLIRRSGVPWLPATISSVALILLLRLAQMWLPGRSAEITDALMTLILALVMKILG